MYHNSICIINSHQMSLSFFFFCFPFLSFLFSFLPSVRPFFCLILVAGFSVLWSVGGPVTLYAFLHTFHSSFPPLLPLLLCPYLSLSLLLSPFLFLTRCTYVVCFFVVCFSEFDSSTRSPILVRACMR
jgi:hypothetical protein